MSRHSNVYVLGLSSGRRLAFVSQVPVIIRLFLEISDGPGACRLSFERALDAIISRSSEKIVTQRASL
jgi:hypothetical protein